MYKVFLVDDEPFIIEGLLDVIDWPALDLEIAGSAGNGQEALQALRETPADILITDISMPVMNGLQLIREARKLRPELKVIILSGYNEFDYLKEGMKLGIENYLLKPINLEELESTLAATLEKLNASRTDRELGAYDIDVLRNHVMHRWLTAQIAPKELEERAALLQLDVHKPHVVTAIVRTGSQEDEMYRHIMRMAESDPSVMPCRDVGGGIVIVFALGDEAAGREKALAFLRRLPGAFPEAGLRISAAGASGSADRVRVSFGRAGKAQEYFLIYPDRELLVYEEIAIEEEKANAQLPVNWPEYGKLIAAKDKDALIAASDGEFDRLQRMEGITPAVLQSVAIEMMIRIKLELKLIKQTDSPDLIREGVERASKARTIAELKTAVAKVAEEAVDSLVRDAKSPVIQQVLGRIHEAYAEDLSLKSLSSQYNIHPVYLGQLFHKETGETFSEYVNRFRVEKAKALLRETNKKVADIARQVGYWETGYFYKQFKRYVGISPKDYQGLL
ncbi:response regulator transcription factor [Paenibacillus humicola]|uniref:response regulator transcription factor n=1 Tax=Paenibacillus humicola TaxID=3110540 RepID=UPI00237C474F|nr:response regulator transcription factor [Paenibacillus humicola]